MSSQKLLTTEQVAEYFNVSAATVYRMIQSRIIPFYKIGGCLRFKEPDLEAYLESQRVKPMDEWFYVAKNKSHPKH